MADERILQDAEPTFQMDLAEAIARLGDVAVGLAREQIELRKVLTKILEERKVLLERFDALDAKVAALSKLIDFHQATLEGAGLAAPRPKGSTGVN